MDATEQMTCLKSPIRVFRLLGNSPPAAGTVHSRGMVLAWPMLSAPSDDPTCIQRPK